MSSEANAPDLEQQVQRFKIDLLRRLPFYGALLTHIPIEPNPGIETAQTNGLRIEYSPAFFSSLTEGQRHFVLMHELFHILLLHVSRRGNRDMEMWNIACDLLVNDLAWCLIPDMKKANIAYERPEKGIFQPRGFKDTAEAIYQDIYEKTVFHKEGGPYRVTIDVGNLIGVHETPEKAEVYPQPDLLEGERNGTGHGLAEYVEQKIREIVQDAQERSRGTGPSYFIPKQLDYALTESRLIHWRTLLREFLSEQPSDETSYTTPERKYIHMDLILPGHGPDTEELEEIWAFVDSSGSIRKKDMEEFLTQLYRIAKEFHCVFNIAYWDTAVTDVYKGIQREKDILTATPRHSGGTDINCVYRWMAKNRVDPDVMLILTDGYFGPLTTSDFRPKYTKKTLLVLSKSGARDVADYRRIGRLVTL